MEQARPARVPEPDEAWAKVRDAVAWVALMPLGRADNVSARNAVVERHMPPGSLAISTPARNAEQQ